jgi:transcriptional/translational regulatory protein YebC/TACO1
MCKLKGCIAPTSPYSVDAVLEMAIEADIEDVQFHSPAPEPDDDDAGGLAGAQAPPQLVVEVSDVTKMEDALAKIGITGVRSIIYIPAALVVVPDEETREMNQRLIDHLESLDEVDAVFHDMEP